MKKILTMLVFCAIATANAIAQDYNQISEDGTIKTKNTNADSLGSDKEIPVGLYVWTVDKRYGDITKAEPDTVPHMFMNDIFTNGRHGEYNFTGNLGSPRIARVFIDRPEDDQFIFTQPYDYFLTPFDQLHFTNTLSPITNITYQNCGNKTNGEDRLKAIFATNAGKKFGMGLKFDYLYGRGYYENQSSSHFNTTFFSSYIGERYNMHFILSLNHQKNTENGGITDDNYITHPESFSSFSANEIPTVLESNWNRNDNQHLFFTHRYSLGFSRKVKMTDAEIKAKEFAMKSMKANADADKEKAHNALDKGKNNKDKKNKNDKKPEMIGRPDNAVIAGDELPDTLKKTDNRITVSNHQQKDSLNAIDKKIADSLALLKDEFVPVTSFIHTLEWHNYDRIYEAYKSPTNYYANTFNNVGKFSGDSIYNETRHYSIKNTFAVALLEGFNKYAKAGLKAFISHELRHFTLPDSLNRGTTAYNENNVTVGGTLSKTLGTTLHYNVTAETCLLGEDIGQFKIDGRGDLNFRLFNDTIQLAARGFIHCLNPGFYYRHYHSSHFWWDNDDMDKEIRTRIEGTLSLKRTKTTIRVAIEELRNYTYMEQTYTIDSTYARHATNVNVYQCGSNINVLTATLKQDFKLGPLMWENEITYQNSSNNDVLPLTKLNIYSNLYLNFRIAKVLLVNLGADLRYFTKYNAPDYRAALGQFCVQGSSSKVEIGNYPIINVYANLHLKHTRFYIMMTHVNKTAGNSFLVPHYPIDPNVIHMGVSWNFFN